MPKIRGYMYEVVEQFPIEDGTGYRVLKTYDRLEDAEAVYQTLEAHNFDWSCHAIVQIPLFEPDIPPQFKDIMNLMDAFQQGWDANGSPTVEK